MEQELLRLAKNGDKSAFSQLIRHYLPRLYSVAFSYVHNVEDAADVCQETFMRVQKNLGSYDADRAFYPWVCRILKNLCLNHLRKARRVALDPDKIDTLPSHYKKPEDSLMEKTESENLRSALKQLPQIHSEILALKVWGCASYRDIAETLDIPIGTVMSRLHNARLGLKKILEERSEWNVKKSN